MLVAYPELPAHEADTELGAVWFAANYYFEASFKRAREYNGWVFRNTRGKYQITGRRGDSALFTQFFPADLPRGVDPVAVWHTHVPTTRALMLTDEKNKNQFIRGPDGKWRMDRSSMPFVDIADMVRHATGSGPSAFSGADKTAAEDLASQVRRGFGHGFALYLCLATLIKRFRVGVEHPETVWRKDPPGRMARNYPPQVLQ
jgi:hypothetical protein